MISKSRVHDCLSSAKWNEAVIKNNKKHNIGKADIIMVNSFDSYIISTSHK